MQKNYVSVRLRPLKDGRLAGFQFRHDMRKRVPSYADPSYQGERATVLFAAPGSPVDWHAEQAEICKQKTGRKMQKNRSWAISGIVTFGQDVNPKPGEIEEYDERARKVVERIADRLGVKLRYLVRHNDESHLHYHFLLDYTRMNGKSLATILSPKRGGKKLLSEIQDMAGQVFADLGLRRGQKKAEKLAFLDELKKVGIEKSLLRKIRTDVLNSKSTLKELHETLQVDYFSKQQIQQKIEAVKAKVLAGDPVSKEEIAICAAEIAKTNVKKAIEFLRLWREQGQNREADVEKQAEQIVQNCKKGLLRRPDMDKVRQIISNLLTTNRTLQQALQRREKEIQAKTEENKELKKALFLLQKKYRKLKKYLQNPAWLRAWLSRLTTPKPEVFGYCNQESQSHRGTTTGNGGEISRTVPVGRCGR